MRSLANMIPAELVLVAQPGKQRKQATIQKFHRAHFAAAIRLRRVAFTAK
jgi:hypothetical protein